MSSGNFGAPPSIDALLAEWWGGPPADPLFQWDAGLASNLTFGGNGVYQITDFLAVYPKFGKFDQAIAAITLQATGSGYLVGDTLSPTTSSGSGAVLTVTSVDGSGAILSLQLAVGGVGYSVASGLATTTNGAGVGAVVNIIAIQAAALLSPLSPTLIQLYINLANASLQQSRWLGTWPLAMALYVAHFLTLFLISDGKASTTAGQAASQGLARGIAVSKSAGDVSVSYQVTPGLEEWGSWNRTEYGQLLATFAKTIGMGPMYVYG